jgi:hypothetical protein
MYLCIIFLPVFRDIIVKAGDMFYSTYFISVNNASYVKRNRRDGGHVNSLQSICHAEVSIANSPTKSFIELQTNSLGRRVLDELNTLANVTGQTLITLCQKLLLVVVGR